MNVEKINVDYISEKYEKYEVLFCFYVYINYKYGNNYFISNLVLF